MRSPLRQTIASLLLALFAAVSSFALSSCGGGGYGDGGGGGGVSYSGTLAITVTGLPNGNNAAITVTGPASYNRAVVASTTLTGLRPGTFTVAAAAVMVGNTNYVPTPVSQTATIAAGSDGYGMGSSASASVAYAIGVSKIEGVITGLDDFSVDEHRYDVSSATVSLNDQLAQVADLRAGMVVSMQVHTLADGSRHADHIRYVADLNGPISSMDQNRQSLVVLGHKVKLTDATVFADAVGNATGLAQLDVGNVVEISGFTAADGSLLARRLERKNYLADSRSLFRIKGVVAGLDTEAAHFSLAALPVKFANAALVALSSPRQSSGNELSDKQRVQVRGYLDSSGVLQATRVVADNDVQQTEGDQGTEIHGLITGADHGAFKLAGYTVQMTDTTRFDRDAALQLRLDAEVTVRGIVSADGTIQALQVTFE